MAASYRLLTYQIHDLPAEEQKARFLDFHTEWAEQPLAGVLSLRGYYVKIGQVVSNQPALLPKPYRKSLKILQEEVPPEPFERIRGIVEVELGKIEDTFAAFDEVPLGAASIGQVHEARLKEGGEEVVVKVQYPEAERFFELDFAVMKLALWYVNPELLDVVKKQQDIFAKEFDYKQEAANLRRMVNEVGGRDFGKAAVTFPEPFEHLTTRKVLVMRKMGGKTLTKIGHELIEELAKSRDMTVDEFNASTRKMILESKGKGMLPEKMGLSNTEFVLIRWWRWLRGQSVPPNGAELMKLLYAEKAYEIFQLGAFNADPHAGNIMLDQENNVVSLLDYGQLITLSQEWRDTFARYIIAIDDGDREEVLKQWKKLGNEWTWQVTGEVNPLNETYACALFHFGGARGVREGMKILEIRGFKEVMDEFSKPKERRKIHITKTPPEYGLLQRACFCLAGVGMQIGFGRASPASMMRAGAEQYLKDREREGWEGGGGGGECS